MISGNLQNIEPGNYTLFVMINQLTYNCRHSKWICAETNYLIKLKTVKLQKPLRDFFSLAHLLPLQRVRRE